MIEFFEALIALYTVPMNAGNAFILVLIAYLIGVRTWR